MVSGLVVEHYMLDEVEPTEVKPSDGEHHKLAWIV